MAIEGGPYFEELIKNNKLDVSKRELVTLKGISKCKELTWLDVSSNNLDSLQWLKKLKEIIVLKASNNMITSIHHILHLKNLKALILNNNCLQSVDGIEKLSSLNSLVLSHNNLQTIDVSNCRHLTKLSLSHNDFRHFPSIEHLSDLKELRLNDNKIEDVPATVSSCKQLKLIDLGNNKISSFGFLEALRTSNVQNLNLKGNKIFFLPGYKEKVLGTLHHMRVLDGRRINDEEKGKSLILSDKAEKETANQKEGAAASLPTTAQQDKPKKCSVDSKPVKVGGFVSRFINDTEKSKVSNEGGTGLESERKRSSSGSKKILSNVKHSAKKVSGKKKQLKEDENFADEGPEEKKAELKKVSTDVPTKSNQERERISALKSEPRGRGEQGTSGDKEMSSIVRKRKRSMAKKDTDDLEKSRKIPKDTRKRENGDVRVVGVSSKNPLAAKNTKTTELSSAKSPRTDEKLDNRSKAEDRAQSRRGSGETVKASTKRPKADKRSGVMGVKVIKRKQQRGAPINLEVLEKTQGHDFGVGIDGGW